MVRGTIATGGQSRCGKLPGATLGKRVTDGDSNTLFPPLLEETHALAPAVGPPQVAPAGGVVAAVIGAVVTGTPAADAGPPKKVDVGGTSEQTIRKIELSIMMMVVAGMGGGGLGEEGNRQRREETREGESHGRTEGEDGVWELECLFSASL